MMLLDSITKNLLIIKLLMDHVMYITNSCLMTQHFSTIKGEKKLCRLLGTLHSD